MGGIAFGAAGLAYEVGQPVGDFAGGCLVAGFAVAGFVGFGVAHRAVVDAVAHVGVAAVGIVWVHFLSPLFGSYLVKSGLARTVSSGYPNVCDMNAGFLCAAVPLHGDVAAPDALCDGACAPATRDLLDAGAGFVVGHGCAHMTHLAVCGLQATGVFVQPP